MKVLKRIGQVLLRPFIDNGVFFVSMYLLGVLCALLTLPAAIVVGRLLYYKSPRQSLR